jgi:FkbM family methyltransferase
VRARALVAQVGRGLRMLALLSDRRSRWRYVALRLGWARGRGPLGTVALGLKPLGGGSLHVRPGGSDVAVLVEDLLYGFHEPPAELAERPLATIVELGTNIGVGLAALAVRYPAATLVGVEADPDSAAVARLNLAQFGERVRLVEAAVWDAEGRLVIDRSEGRASGFTVRLAGPGEAGDLTAITVDQVLERIGPGAGADYLYMDVEGAQRRLLGGDAPWAERVGAIKVSAHHGTDYSEQDCARDLERLGFKTRVIELDPTGWTVGVRERV